MGNWSEKMGAGNLERENLSRKTRVRRPGQNPGGISNRKQQWQNLKDPLSVLILMLNRSTIQKPRTFTRPLETLKPWAPYQYKTTGLSPDQQGERYLF